MLNPDIPPDQLKIIQPILEPLLDRLRAQVKNLPSQADSALVYHIAREHAEYEAPR